MQRLLLILSLGFVFMGPLPAATAPPGTGVASLPMTCAELLPDLAPYLGFFEAVARAQVARDRTLSRRLYRILGKRQRLAEEKEVLHDQNPIDAILRRTLCFYREQKEPLKPVNFDDREFVRFLKGSLKELEGKVDDTIFQVEFERQRRLEYKRQLEQNRGVVEAVRREADEEADREFDRLSAAARRKVRSQ